MKNLVGRTVRISPQDKNKGGNKTRSVAVNYEYYENNVRMYNVTDIETNENYPANADKYDELFLTGFKKILPKHTKDVIHNTSNINYNK